MNPEIFIKLQTAGFTEDQFQILLEIFKEIDEKINNNSFEIYSLNDNIIECEERLIEKIENTDVVIFNEIEKFSFILDSSIARLDDRMDGIQHEIVTISLI